MEDKTIERPFGIDISKELRLKDSEEEIDAKVTSVLRKISDKWKKGRDGLLIVMGNFFRGFVPNMDFLRENMVTENDNIWITDKNIEKKLMHYSEEPNDGAILININGRVVAAGVNLILDDKDMLKKAKENNVQDGGMRHIAGIYTSMRDDILSVYILSGENGRVSVWKRGTRYGKIYDPNDKEPNGKSLLIDETDDKPENGG